MGERQNNFPQRVRREVKEDQGFRCFYCNGLCRGPEYHEPRLEAHHVVPASVNGPPTRENAVGLCGSTGHSEGCHCHFDRLYFQEKKTIFEVMMEENRIYDLRQHPAFRTSVSEVVFQRKQH